MRVVLLLLFLLLSLRVSSADTLTYEQFRYEFLHYSHHNYNYNGRIYTDKDFLMSGISLTGVAAMNVLYFSKKVYWTNSSSDKVHHNSPYAMLAFDAVAVGIQIYYYLKKQ